LKIAEQRKMQQIEVDISKTRGRAGEAITVMAHTHGDFFACYESTLPNGTLIICIAGGDDGMWWETHHFLPQHACHVLLALSQVAQAARWNRTEK
jgi:hypothetical protein